MSGSRLPQNEPLTIDQTTETLTAWQALVVVLVYYGAGIATDAGCRPCPAGTTACSCQFHEIHSEDLVLTLAISRLLC